MQYKTMVLEMIRQRTSLHNRLASSGRLLSTTEQLAMDLRDVHRELVEQLRQTRPESAELQLSSEAMEIAVRELEQALPDESPQNSEEVFSLDAAMAFVRRHAPS